MFSSFSDSSIASNSNIEASSHVLGLAKINSKDIGYNYGSVMDLDKTMITYLHVVFSKKIYRRITRFKHHLIHKRVNTTGCDKVHLDVHVFVQNTMTESFNEKHQKIRV